MKLVQLTMLGDEPKLLLLNPRYVVQVIGSSADPTAGDTGAGVALANGQHFEVVESARLVAELLEEAGRHG